MKDLEWRGGEGGEVRNRTIWIISRFSMARGEQKESGGNGLTQDEKVWLGHDKKRHLNQ